MDKQTATSIQWNSILQQSEMIYQAIKKAWRNFKYVSLSGRRRSEKATYYAILILRHSEKGKTLETVKRSVVARDLGGGMNVWSTGHF